MTVVPYQESDASKKVQIAQMFDNIAFKYDFLNHILSMGIDKIWRKKAIKLLATNNPKKILDVATGTADFAIACNALKPQNITGVDISSGMVAIGQKKIMNLGLQNIIQLQVADAEKLPFENNSFDACTVAFGVRNFEQLQIGLQEIYRVLSPQSQFVILEFSKPTNAFFNFFYSFYFKNIVPIIGKIFSKDISAYTYLYNSVQAFPDRENFLEEMKKAGFTNSKFTSLTFGICCIYQGFK